MRSIAESAARARGAIQMPVLYNDWWVDFRGFEPVVCVCESEREREREIGCQRLENEGTDK